MNIKIEDQIYDNKVVDKVAVFTETTEIKRVSYTELFNEKVILENKLKEIKKLLRKFKVK